MTTVYPSGTRFLVRRRPVLPEDERRYFTVGEVATIDEAQALIEQYRRPSYYFHASDFEIVPVLAAVERKEQE